MKRAINVVLLCEGNALPDEQTVLATLQRVIDEGRLDARITIATPPDVCPELDTDRRYYGETHKMSARCKSERRVVWALLQHLAAHDWQVHEVDDGDTKTEVHDPKSAMELIFNLDDCYLYVRNTKTGREHWLRFVLGNDPDEVLNDYSYSERNNFAEIVEAFKPEDHV